MTRYVDILIDDLLEIFSLLPIGHVSAQISGVGPAAVARTHAKDDSAGSHRYNNFDT